MARPKSEQPTPAELEVLKIVWESGPRNIRQVWEILNQQRERHYTSVASLLATMAEKQMLECEVQGRTLVYRAAIAREQTLGEIVETLVDRAFEGSASALMLQVLDQCNPSAEEMDAIAKVLREYRKRVGEKS
jgi:BlaI family transcriptional regulator, penicillinase repressor